MAAELDIEEHYKIWEDYKEEEVNKEVLYNYLKSKPKPTSKLGPFRGSQKEAETSRLQYDSVFS